jgi:hypothetical protein
MVSVATVSLVAASAGAGGPAQTRNNRAHVETANDRVLLPNCRKRTLATGNLSSSMITLCDATLTCPRARPTMPDQRDASAT